MTAVEAQVAIQHITDQILLSSHFVSTPASPYRDQTQMRPTFPAGGSWTLPFEKISAIDAGALQPGPIAIDDLFQRKADPMNAVRSYVSRLTHDGVWQAIP